MKNLLIATTAIVATAGMASAEVTFSGKGEAGMYQTAGTAAVKAVAGVKAVQNTSLSLTAAPTANATGKTMSLVNGVLNTVAATTSTASVAADVTTAKTNLRTAKAALLVAEKNLLAASTAATIDTTQSAVGDKQALLAIAQATHDAVVGTAVAAKGKSSDMAAYSGYDMNVAVSAESDNGIVFGMGFDMGAGLIADQNDDRAMDTQGGTIATSALTATMNGYKLSIGSDKLDDTYDDSQNGDIGLSGNVGGVAFNLVHDLTDEVVAKAAKYKATNVGSARTAASRNAAGAVVAAASTIAIGDDDVVNSAYSAAVAATVESTSLSLGGATGAISWSLASTTGNDSGDSAAKGSLTYTGVENLSLKLAHDNAGKLEGITKVTAAYTMGSLTATLAMADDKDHAGNTNKNTKASSNLSLAYAANGLAATFATDESSQWWVNTQYDLGGGAQAFATIDHTEFAVVGLNFNF